MVSRSRTMWWLLFSLLIAVAFILLVNLTTSHIRISKARTAYDYDAIIVGGSIVGPTVAKALADQNRKVLLLERSLFQKPDRIVGELLQPGGIEALRQLGMQQCALSVGTPCSGYVVVDDEGHKVTLPYPNGYTGCSFHFGDFVNKLREFVWYNCSSNVRMVEATVTNLLCEGIGPMRRAYGVEYTVGENDKVPETPFRNNCKESGAPLLGKRTTHKATAPLIIMCDGGASKFKAKYQHYTPAKAYHSNFVGLVLEGIQLPIEHHGTVFFGKTGPILSYRLDNNEVRMLADYNKPDLPTIEGQSTWLQEVVAPQLPEGIREEVIRKAKDVRNIRSMPVAQYPQTFPAIKGYVGLGDHNNQRHPLTGGGMTCAFRDALRFAENLKCIPNLRSENANSMALIEDDIQLAIINYSRRRFWHSSCINILSWALYAVFSSPKLRAACFDYFGFGGDCVAGPMALLAGLDPSPLTLLRHYYTVMFYGALNLITGAGRFKNKEGRSLGAFQMVVNALKFAVNPSRWLEGIHLAVEATIIIVPLIMNEVVWFWHFIDPTSALAMIFREIKITLHRQLYNSRAGKPIGL